MAKKSFEDLFDDACRSMQATVNSSAAKTIHENRKEHKQTRDEMNSGFRNMQATVNHGVAHVEHTMDEGFRRQQQTTNQAAATVISDNRKEHEATRKALGGHLGILWLAVVAIGVVAAVAAFLITYNCKYKAAEQAADGGNGSSFVVSKMVPDQVDAKTGNVKSYKEERKIDTVSIRLFARSYAIPMAGAIGLVATFIAIILMGWIANKTPSHRRG